MKREYWLQKRADWERALYAIALDKGKESPTYKALGTVAWCRYDGERVPNETLDNVAFGAGFLQGVRYALLQASGAGQFSGDPFRYIHDRINRYEAERKRADQKETP